MNKLKKLFFFLKTGGLFRLGSIIIKVINFLFGYYFRRGNIYKKDEGIIIFNYSYGVYIDFFLPVYNELKGKRKNIVLLVDCIHPEFHWSKEFDYSDVILAHNLKALEIVDKLFIHVTSIPNMLRELPKSTHIQMNHGFGSFDAALDESYLAGKENTVFVANTKFQMTQLLSHPKYSKLIRTDNIHFLGYPKLDGKVAVNKINENISDIKTIFYGPTYHKDISSIFDFFEELIELVIEHNITLYIKLHPFLTYVYDEEKSGGIDWGKKIQNLSKQYSNIRLVSNKIPFEDVCDLFHESDLFLTDNSGLGLEYSLITGRPCVFLGKKIKVPLIFVREGRYDDFKEFPEVKYRGYIGPIIENSVDLRQMLTPNYLKVYQNNVENFRSEFTANLGKSSPEIVRLISRYV